MKDIPSNLPLKAYHAITTRKVGELETSHKTCLIGGDQCARAINSHSVPLSALRTIAHDGHVFTFTNPTYEELKKVYSECKYQPKPLGINESSTFFGFCQNHDDSIFSEIEKFDIKPTDKQIILFYFRAYSKTFYQNINGKKILNEIYNAKRPDGHDAIDALAKVASYFKYQELAKSDIISDFEKIKLNVCTNKKSGLSSIFIRINGAPDVMCSVILSPIYDVAGDFLLPLAIGNELDSNQVMSITISKDSIGGFILLSYSGKDSLTSYFIDAFVKSGYDCNRLIAVIFGNTENFFFSEKWWKGLCDERRNMLMYFASVSFLDQADSARNHWKKMYRVLVGRQKVYVNWQILSINHINI
jgi:hypothetical protein